MKLRRMCQYVLTNGNFLRYLQVGPCILHDFKTMRPYINVRNWGFTFPIRHLRSMVLTSLLLCFVPLDPAPGSLWVGFICQSIVVPTDREWGAKHGETTLLWPGRERKAHSREIGGSPLLDSTGNGRAKRRLMFIVLMFVVSSWWKHLKCGNLSKID